MCENGFIAVDIVAFLVIGFLAKDLKYELKHA